MDPVQIIKDNPDKDKANFSLASTRNQNSEFENSNYDEDVEITQTKGQETDDSENSTIISSAAPITLKKRKPRTSYL